MLHPPSKFVVVCTVPQPSEASIAGPSLVIVFIICCLPGVHYLSILQLHNIPEGLYMNYVIRNPPENVFYRRRLNT